MDNKNNFEPKIVGFVCRWCSGAGADLAGTSRLHYPANVVFIKTMCSGRIDPQHVFEAFRKGADGVLISGCHPGDCHYTKGNYATLRRFQLLRRMLKQMGIDQNRLRLEWISASEAERVKEVVEDMVKNLKQAGPLRLDKAETEAVKA